MNRLTLLALVAVLSLAVAGCGGDGTATPGATETTAAPPPPSTSTQPTATTPTPSVTTIRIVFKDGKVVGGLKRTTVGKGAKVVLVVSSDVADEVHVHGYDKSVDVATGTPARLPFVASLPGRFEIELEDRALQIADLEVRP